MTAWRRIEDEHQAHAAIIHGLRYLIEAIEEGRQQPDFELLRAMVHYVAEYPERSHHPKEDRFLFARLKEKTHEADAVIVRPATTARMVANATPAMIAIRTAPPSSNASAGAAALALPGMLAILSGPTSHAAP